MAEHTLAPGRRLIHGLSTLGSALGYDVRREYPVLPAIAGPAMAVDVAWFGEKRQRYPLMIFEVETRAGNTIANNPLKVFGQDSTQFEKPLFYFHVVVQRGEESARAELLARQYGTHNYRLYRLGLDEGTQLVKDVLRQHARIRHRLDHVTVYEALAGADWADLVDPIAVLDEADSLRLSDGERVQAILHLARKHQNVRARLPRLVEEAYASKWAIGNLKTFLGQEWAPALLMAWMIGTAGSADEADGWDVRLSVWQNESSYMPMFCSHVALSRDYAEFLLGLGGPFVALLAGLSRGRGETIRTFLAVLLETLDRVPRSWVGLQLALWGCHIASRLRLEPEFEQARSFVNDVGVAEGDLFQPPSTVSVTELSREEQFSDGDRVTCPPMADFIAAVNTRDYALKQDLTRTDLLLRTLDDDSFFYEWAEPVLALVWNDRGGDEPPL